MEQYSLYFLLPETSSISVWHSFLAGTLLCLPPFLLNFYYFCVALKKVDGGMYHTALRSSIMVIIRKNYLWYVPTFKRLSDSKIGAHFGLQGGNLWHFFIFVVDGMYILHWQSLSKIVLKCSIQKPKDSHIGLPSVSFVMSFTVVIKKESCSVNASGTGWCP